MIDRNIPDVIQKELNNRIITEETKLSDHLNDDWAIFVLKEFSQDSKGAMSRHFSEKPDNEFRDRFSCLEQLILEINSYLFPED